MVPRFRSRNFGGMLPVGDAYAKHPVGVGGAYTPTRRHETDAEKFRRRRGRIYAPYRRSPKPLYRYCIGWCTIFTPPWGSGERARCVFHSQCLCFTANV